MINFMLLVSRQGKTRLSKWYDHYSTKEKTRVIRELTQLVLSRPPKLCNFIEWRDKKVSTGDVLGPGESQATEAHLLLLVC